VDAAATAPDPAAALAAYAAFEAGITRLHADAKRAANRFAAVTCSCASRFDWADRMPPQVGCAVHGNIVITAKGLIL
jgi:hypothetical protein